MRSLADDLRSRDDAALVALLGTRADLLAPVPTDVGALAARATAAPSIARALDRLTLPALQVLDVLCTLPEPTTLGDISRRWGADLAATAQVLASLHEQALVWGDADELRLVRVVRQMVREPAGLGPSAEQLLIARSPMTTAQLVEVHGGSPSGDLVADARFVAAALGDRAHLQRLLDDAPLEADKVLARLTWGPPSGQVPDALRNVKVATARTPVDWLLARGLLIATTISTVMLPLEVALHVRGGHVHREPAVAPPDLALVARDKRTVEATSGTAASEILRHTEDLLEAWGVDAPVVLRAGGIGVREIKKAAVLLDTDETTAAFVAETAYVAGLLGRSGDADELWLPTPAYDTWLVQTPGRRWVGLAQAWLTTTRVAALVGTKGERDRVYNALGPDLDRSIAPEVRLGVLRALADAPVHTAVQDDSLRERLRWHRPRRSGGLRDDLVTWTLREAELLGLTGRGALSAAARDFTVDDPESAASRIARAMPQPVEEVLLQADLTAVAPGPLVPELAREIGLLADVESTGGATVYRFSPQSVRRAYDAGRTADDVHAMLAKLSRTAVPQALTYLVDDVARRHGRVRVGVSSAYIRSDDPAVLAEVLGDRRAASLRLRKLAPTVLAAQVPVEVVLDKLRAMGLAPAAESSDGAMLVRRPDSRRTPARPRPPRLVSEPTAPEPTMLNAAVRAIRAGDRAATAVRHIVTLPPNGGLVRTPVGELVAQLRRASTERFPVVIGYLNAEGSTSERVIDPISVEGGFVSAYDHLRDETRTFALARITGIAGVDAVAE